MQQLKQVLKNSLYWRSTFFMGIGFVVLYTVVLHFMQQGSLSLDVFTQHYISNGKWVRFLLSRMVGGLFYGGIMSYYILTKKTNQQSI